MFTKCICNACCYYSLSIGWLILLMRRTRAYDERIREVHGAQILLPPCLFNRRRNGPNSKINVVYKRIASMTAQKQDKTYSKIIHWIRCKLSNYVPKRTIPYSIYGHNGPGMPRGPSRTIYRDTMDLACQEGRVPLN